MSNTKNTRKMTNRGQGQRRGFAYKETTTEVIKPNTNKSVNGSHVRNLGLTIRGGGKEASAEAGDKATESLLSSMAKKSSKRSKK